MFYLRCDFSVQANVAANICRLKACVVVDACYGTCGHFQILVFIDKRLLNRHVFSVWCP